MASLPVADTLGFREQPPSPGYAGPTGPDVGG